MTVTTAIQSEWMSHIEGRPIPDGEHAHVLTTTRGPVVFFINRLNRHLVILKPKKGGGQEVLDLSSLWKLSGQVSCLATSQGPDGGLHLFFAKESTQEGLFGKLFAIVPILPQDFDDEAVWRNALREFAPFVFQSGNAKVQSITLNLLASGTSTATVVLKIDDTWKAVSMKFSELGNEECTSMEEKEEPTKETTALDEAKKVESTKNPIKLPQLIGIKVDFAKHPDPDTTPKLIPGNFDGKPGLFYYFSTKGSVRFGFRQDDGNSRWFEPPSDPLNSMQIVGGDDLAGGLLVGTSKALLLYSPIPTVSLKPENGNEDKKTSLVDRLLGHDTELAQPVETGKPELMVDGPFDKNNGELIEKVEGKDEKVEKKDEKVEGKNEKVEKKDEKAEKKDEKKSKQDKMSPVIIHSGPASQLKLGSALAGKNNTIWMLFGDELRTLGYFRYDKSVDSKIGIEEPVLIPIVETKLSGFSASISVDGSAESVLYQTASGCNLLERSATGIWSEKLFEIPAPIVVKMAPAYISHIKFSTSDFAALHGSRFHLTCTSSVTVLVNDAPLLIDEKPQLVGLDTHGKIEIVNFTDTLQTPNFALQNAPGTSVLGDPLTIDPAHKAKRRMQKMTSPSDLKELTVGKERKPLFPEATDFDKLSGVVKDMYEQMDTLPADGTRKTDIKPLEDRDTESWSLFHMVETTISSVQDFAVEGGHLVITVAGKIVGFVIDCFETALKGLSTIFAAAGAAVEDLQHWLGYVFDWDDIVETHSSLATVFNFTISMPDNIFEQAYTAVDGSLATISHNLSDKMGLDDKMNQSTSNPENLVKVEGRKTPDPEQQTPILSHPAIDYIFNKLSNILAGNLIAINLDLDSGMIASVQKVLDQNGDLISQLTALARQVIEGKHISMLQLVELIGETALVAVINAIRAIIASFKKAVQSMIHALKDVINKPRNIPLLSALYKFATGTNQDPSLLQIAALVLAIPVSITCKILKGVKFPVFTNENLAGLAEQTSETSGGTRVSSLATLYDSVVPHLEIWIQEQPRTLGWIDLLHTTITTLGVVCPDVPDVGLQEMQPDESGTVKVDNVTVIRTILQSFSVLASIPMIKAEQWEGTAAPELRFQAWGLESGLRVIEIITSWIGVQDERAAAYTKSLLVVRNTLSLVIWSKIAAAEHAHRLPNMTDDDFSKAQILAVWTVPESLALYASHIAPVAVVKSTPENIRGVVALTAFGLGVAGNASRWARCEYQGNIGHGFSTGLI